MDEIGRAGMLAMRLIIGLDAEVVAIVALSLRVSLSAAAFAFLVGAPLGALLAVVGFRGRRMALVIVNALLGLPPVVVGLFVYLALSRAGPLGALGLLFTPSAMIVAQGLLALPIVVALSHRAVEPHWRDYGDALTIDGAGRGLMLITLLTMARVGLVTAFLTAFGRVIAEVGAIQIVGGNIRGHTRTMTTAIALETSRGELALALALGLVLVACAVVVSAAAFLAAGREPR